MTSGHEIFSIINKGLAAPKQPYAGSKIRLGGKNKKARGKGCFGGKKL